MSSTSGGRSVGIVRLRTKGHGVCFRWKHSGTPWKGDQPSSGRCLPTGQQKTNSVAFRPQANYRDWAATTCWRNLVPTFVDRGVSRDQPGGSPTVVNLNFIDRDTVYNGKECCFLSLDLSVLFCLIYFLFLVWWPPLWSSGRSSWLLTQRSRVRFPALPDFLSSSGSGTVSTRPLWG
jgi:hypothetical protein